MGDIERRNVFVVGAGASAVFGLPTGLKLKSSIRKITDLRFNSIDQLESGDWKVLEAIRSLATERGDSHINDYLHAGWRIRDNMNYAPSIDNFLDTHRDDERLVEFGKVAITYAIQEAENASLLSANNGENFHSKTEETWAASLFRLLVAERTFEDFLRALEGISFVSFNYDRCIQQFFVKISKSYFGLDHSRTLQVLNALDINYAYGCIGDFQLNPHNSNFGKISTGTELVEFSRKIKTFTEGSDSTSK